MIITTDCVTEMGAKALHTAHGRPKSCSKKRNGCDQYLCLNQQNRFPGSLILGRVGAAEKKITVVVVTFG